jgi:S1-C subfamily serine protease
MLQRLTDPVLAIGGAWRQMWRRGTPADLIAAVDARGSRNCAAELRTAHSMLPRTSRRHWPSIATLALVAALLPMSCGVGAESRHEWAFAQRLTLGDRTSVLCYDRGSLRAEGNAIRVSVRQRIADHALTNACATPDGEPAGITIDSEILIRCGDLHWRAVRTANAPGKTQRSSENPWREAASGNYSTLIERICARAAPSQDRGPAVSGTNSATAGAAAQRTSSGTGFFVDGNGNALTNHHVVERCRQVVLVAADKRWQARVVARDPMLDLALIKVDRASTSYATFRANPPPRAGESVTAVGFPLRGLLASEPNVSTGIVNAVAGIRDDASRFQISAPVQSGNSGGPVLDAGGMVLGVVVSKLDAMKVARETGDMPQNINFAIKGELARAFLTAHGIPARTGGWTRPIDTIGVAAIARSMTVAVECR